MCATTTGDARIGDWSSRYPSVSLPSKRPTVCPTSNGEISSEGSSTSTGGRHDRVFVPDGVEPRHRHGIVASWPPECCRVSKLKESSTLARSDLSWEDPPDGLLVWTRMAGSPHRHRRAVSRDFRSPAP